MTADQVTFLMQKNPAITLLVAIVMIGGFVVLAERLTRRKEW